MHLLRWFKNKSTVIKVAMALSTVLIVWFIFCLPQPIFNDPLSTIIEDHNHKLLAAQIATDGQWRFPQSDSVPYKFKQCIIYFEDQYFYKHPGINPVSLVRAIKQNLKAKKVISGGSTISSQVIRLSRKGKNRNIGQKAIEFIKAVRLELRYSKQEILSLYTSNAPFGGNVVGLEAASWRYFGREPYKLSWGESATLAVLPNAPSLIFPGKNHDLLLKKRNRLLEKLYQNQVIDSFTCELSKTEPLPQHPKELPQLAPHLLTRIINDRQQGKRILSTLDKNTQDATNRIINKHYQVLSQNGVMNAAALVIDVETGNVLAYVGNTTSQKNESGNYVDIIPAPRSSGSTLKPLLYAFMQKDGVMLPKTLIPDIPTQLSGYSPKNFDDRYDGAVHANNALARSLNIPAIQMLKQYGLELFYEQLKAFHFSTINKPVEHYGLSIILGGAEVTLWDLAGTYASMSRVLNHYTVNNSLYQPADYHSLNYQLSPINGLAEKLQETDLLGAGSIWLTFEALTEMQRPMEGTSWKLFESSRKIAWKTGTSFGFRDAWAVGITPKYVVAVWVGNADGEGRPGLTGASSAAPIMFDIFKQLPSTEWFNMPYDDLQPIVVCHQSGYKASPICTQVDTIYAATKGDRTEICPYHKLIYLNKEKQYQVNSDCYPVKDMVSESWFILPPVMEWYYKSVDPFYKVLPPYMQDCMGEHRQNMDIIYPPSEIKVFIPKGLNTKFQPVVFEVAHRQADAIIYWHLDETYLGSTQGVHKMEILATEGMHTLTLIDNSGEIKKRIFEVLPK